MLNCHWKYNPKKIIIQSLATTLTTNNVHTIMWRFRVFLSNTYSLFTVVWFQVFLSNTNNYKISRNYFHSIILIFFTVKGYQVFLSNTKIFNKICWTYRWDSNMYHNSKQEVMVMKGGLKTCKSSWTGASSPDDNESLLTRLPTSCSTVNQFFVL